MRIEFATCVRSTALRYIQEAYKERAVTDSPDSAGPLLDLVELDVIRVRDPMMYGSAAVVGSTNWDESHRKSVTDAIARLSS